MDLYFTRLNNWTWDPVTGRSGPVNESEGRALGLQEGLPFFVAEDGAYDLELASFFSQLRIRGVHSRHSWRAYARDIAVFFRFLAEARGGKTWKTVVEDDLVAFRLARRDPSSSAQVSARSWNRALVALEHLYRWAVRTSLLPQLPYEVRIVQLPRGRGKTYRRVSVDTSNLRDPRGHGVKSIRFLSREDYQEWRDIGLKGRLPSALVDPAWRGTNGVRDAVFADLLATSGMRVGEATSLTLPEIATSLADAKREAANAWLPLSASMTKGSKERRVLVPVSVLRRLVRYAEVEREAAVYHLTLRDQRGVVKHLSNCEIATDGRVKIQNQKRGRALGLLDLRERRRLVVRRADGMVDPLLLFLSRDGNPMMPVSWSQVFRRANARCRLHGKERRVSPHWLRHTFAVNFLERAVEDLLARTDPQRINDPGARIYKRVLGDPVRQLQLLLGHADVTTTYVYLDHLSEVSDTIAAALTQWAEELEVEAHG
jgi:site-specific recombinase XerD